MAFFTKGLVAVTLFVLAHSGLNLPGSSPSCPTPAPPTPAPTYQRCNGIFDTPCPSSYVCFCTQADCGWYPGYEGCRGSCVPPTVQLNVPNTFVCRETTTASPTVEPTDMPSNEPSVSPAAVIMTGAPSIAPTDEPSIAPTVSPTDVLSAAKVASVNSGADSLSADVAYLKWSNTAILIGFALLLLCVVFVGIGCLCYWHKKQKVRTQETMLQLQQSDAFDNMNEL